MEEIIKDLLRELAHSAITLKNLSPRQQLQLLHHLNEISTTGKFEPLSDSYFCRNPLPDLGDLKDIFCEEMALSGKDKDEVIKEFFNSKQ